eukprot:351969-Chlamydomonas_euryale.AAC.3
MPGGGRLLEAVQMAREDAMPGGGRLLEAVQMTREDAMPGGRSLRLASHGRADVCAGMDGWTCACMQQGWVSSEQKGRQAEGSMDA